MSPADQPFDASGGDSVQPGESRSAAPLPPDAWPSCPQCGALRLTHCPICETVGSDFPPADRQPASSPQTPSTLAPARMVLCPTCDEPFVPAHANRCPWCGHSFPDGYEVAIHQADADEAYSRRLAVLLGVVALILAFFLGLILLQ